MSQDHPETTDKLALALAVIEEVSDLPDTSRMSLGTARVLAREVHRLQAENAQLRAQHQKLLRDALEGLEQTALHAFKAGEENAKRS